MNNQKWLVIMTWLGLLLLPPLLINVWLLLPGALEVAQTAFVPPLRQTFLNIPVPQQTMFSA